jgi:hypothetical protein
MSEERNMLASNTNEGPENDEVEAHGLPDNTNEDLAVAWDNEVEAHALHEGQNTNEDAADDEVEGHALSGLNTNESAEDDER